MESCSSNKRYSGRLFSRQEIDKIRQLIHADPQVNRQQLSYRVCELFDWRKSDGNLKDMSCRVALLRMHREGLIELPAPRHKVNPCRGFTQRTVQAQPESLLEAAVHELPSLRLELVGRKNLSLIHI